MMRDSSRTSEQARLAALDDYDILDTPSEEAFDRITRLTRNIFGVPIATITFVDGHRQWFKSQVGMPDCETAREPAFCNLTIRQDAPLVVPDATADERFKANPFVVGEPYIRFYAGVPLKSADGHNIGTLCAMDHKPRSFDAGQLQILSDLADVVMSELELRKIAVTDGLTGALSRRAFREEAGRAVSLALRHGHPLSCVVFDLDHFKAINDGNGHAAGDMVLREAVAACRSKLRKSDLLGRMGGEEFAILLPHVVGKSALTVAEKIRAAIAHLQLPGLAKAIHVSASFGVVSLDRTVGDIDDLLKRADEALYSAKGHGRNRCVVWQSTEEKQPELRRRVFKTGRISFNLGQSTVDCTVRSLSETGAGIDVFSTVGIPDQFKLQIDSADTFRACHVQTKKDKHLEVAFE